MAQNNYMQVQDMTDEELFKVYMKLSKKEIVGMLIQCNKILKAIKPRAVPIEPSNNYRAVINIYSEDAGLNTELSHEIYDRLDRLGYSPSLEDGKKIEFVSKLESRGVIKIITKKTKSDNNG